MANTTLYLKQVTVADLAKYLRTIPNQNLPVSVVATAEGFNGYAETITGDIGYIEHDDKSVEIHVSGEFPDGSLE